MDVDKWLAPICAKVYAFFHINRDRNPADIVSKHWAHAKVWGIG